MSNLISLFGARKAPVNNVIHFPKAPVRPIERPLIISTEDLQFQQIIREQSAERRKILESRRLNFERFWNLFGGSADCGNPTGRPE